jgi:hypothetical protein
MGACRVTEEMPKTTNVLNSHPAAVLEKTGRPLTRSIILEQQAPGKLFAFVLCQEEYSTRRVDSNFYETSDFSLRRLNAARCAHPNRRPHPIIEEDHREVVAQAHASKCSKITAKNLSE